MRTIAAAVLLAMTAVAAAAQTRAGGAPGATGPAYALIALPSGRVLAAARADVLTTRVLPGSVIKVATLIAAMEQGVVDDTTRILCQRVADVDGRQITCVHPDLHRPLRPEEALGLSCNVFFATIARRIGRAGFNDVLVRLGLPPADVAAPMVSIAIGLSGIRATPRALLNALVRLTAGESEFRMADRTRDVLLAGLRLASSSGTASALGSAGFRAFAKTGTAPMAGGGFQGLLVATLPDEHPRYGIVVLVPGGAGSDAAGIAADLLVRHGAAHGPGDADSQPGPATIRVGRARRSGGYDIQSLPIEEYVSQVVSGEMAPAAPVAALEALAITVRTFAVANRDRHQADGFDLCDLTHCQVLGRATAETGRASAATRNLVLFDGHSVAHVYFSAACGGYTEVPSHVWPGAADPAYLPARADPACAGEVRWSAEMPEPQLRRVLRAAGLRGSGIREFKVASRHRSGRAALLEVAGMQPPAIDASLFRTFAGRVLGWNVVKSTMFDVRRSGAGYVLTGSGLGHGVGLCVRGSAERARGGTGRDAILSAYFPGLSVTTWQGIAGQEPAVRVDLPESDRRDLSEVRDTARRLFAGVARRLDATQPADTVVRFHPTVESYTRETGQPWWTAARTGGTRIDLVPLGVLRQRGTLESTLRHEFVHVLTDSRLQDRPLWVREGLAVVIAGELGVPPERSRRGPIERCPTDAELRTPASPDAWRHAYAAAGACVERVLKTGRRWQELR